MDVVTVSAVAGNARPCIRPAGAGDVGRLLSLMKLLAEEEGLATSLQADAQSLLRDGFGPSPKFRVLLAQVEAEAVAYLSYTVGYSIWAGGSMLLLDDLFVVRAWRGRGIGRSLLDSARRICVAQSHIQARWTVELRNRAAIRFRLTEAPLEALATRSAARLPEWRTG